MWGRVSAHCSRDNRTSQTTGLHLLLRLPKLIWLNFKLRETLIVPENYFRLHQTKIMLGWFCCVAGEQSFSSTRQTSLWFLSLFDFCFKYLCYLLYWFQLCLLIYAHRHQIPLHAAVSELIGSSFVFILTVGELQCWLNSSLSWMEPFAERSRKGAGLADASCLSQGENCFCSHNSHNISPSLARSSEGHIWRGGEWFRLRHLCLSLVFFMSVHFLSGKKWKVFWSLIPPIVHQVLTKV